MISESHHISHKFFFKSLCRSQSPQIRQLILHISDRKGYVDESVGELTSTKRALQGYLAHKKHPPPRTLQWDYTYGPIAVLGGGAVSYERGTPVTRMIV